jgi:hypothetical protein
MRTSSAICAWDWVFHNRQPIDTISVYIVGRHIHRSSIHYPGGGVKADEQAKIKIGAWN